MAPDDLTDAELQLLEAFAAGRPFDGTDADPRPDDHGSGPARSRGPAIRADVIRGLLTGGTPVEQHRTRLLDLAGVQVVGVLDLAHTRLTHPLSLKHCSFTEAPDLRWAELRSVTFSHCLVPGLRMDNAVVDGDLSLSAATVSGPVAASAARVTGSVDLGAATISCTSAPAFDAARLSVGGNLCLDDGFTATGEVFLVDAHVAGRLDLSGATVRHAGRTALQGSRLVVDGPVIARAPFTVEGSVVLRRARIGGFVDFTGARFVNPGGDALLAPVLRADSLSCGGAEFRGGISLVDAHIRGPLDLSGTRVLHRGMVAFAGARLIVDGPILCRGNFTADGQVSLRRAVVGGFIDFADAELSNPGGDALFAPVLTAEGGIFCRQSSFAGRVSLQRARVPGSVDLSGADIHSLTTVALTCANLTTPQLRLPRKAVTGPIDLRHARLVVLDAPIASSPSGIHATGLTYETLEPLLDAGQRIRWLGTDYAPQPFEQLASSYRRVGHDADARHVLLAKQRRRRQSLPAGEKAWGLLQDLATGYGYRPGLAAGWLAALLLLGTTVFTRHPPTAKPGAPPFHAFFYTLDLLLPILTYGQESSFLPRGGYQWLAFGLVTAGWVLATAVIAGITRVLSRG